MGLMTDLIELLNEQILEKTHPEISDADRHRIEGLALAREIIAPHLETVTQQLNKPLLRINGITAPWGVHEVLIEHDYMGGTTVSITTEDGLDYYDPRG